jgi:putative DNA primase/helicase
MNEENMSTPLGGGKETCYDVDGSLKEFLRDQKNQNAKIDFFHTVCNKYGKNGRAEEYLKKASVSLRIDESEFLNEFYSYFENHEYNASPPKIPKKSKPEKHGQTAEWFDEKGNFVPPQLAEAILSENRLSFDRGELYFYEYGVYKPGGEKFVDSIVLKKLGDKYRKKRGEEVTHYIKTKTWDESLKLDDNPDFINFLNGVYDLKTKKLLDHTPEIYASIKIPVEYNPEAECPAIDRFLSEILPADCIDLVYEFFGYCLVYDDRNRFEKAILLIGEGSNGKSTLLKLLERFLGKKNVSSESLQDLASSRFRASNLAGKLANIFPDLDSQALKSTGKFKALVSGDNISVERKFKEPFDLQNRAKMIFSANELPRTHDTTFAFYKRLVIIPFPNQFEGNEADRNLLEKLTTGVELSGLLNMAIEGLLRLTERGDFLQPESTTREMEKYKTENENVKQFINEVCIIGRGNVISRVLLYDEYKKWADQSGVRPFSRNQFYKRIEKHIPSLQVVRVGMAKLISYMGIDIKGEYYGVDNE